MDKVIAVVDRHGGLAYRGSTDEPGDFHAFILRKIGEIDGYDIVDLLREICELEGDLVC
jgi:hypothetical protein